MSDLAKKARAAMKSKAERLGASRPMEKVSSADWSPPELLNADVKTGMRPVSRRAFKKGGKVTGEACAPRADRKPRKAGGKAEYKAEATEFANAKVNRNVKAANEQREGVKHVGGMARGGKLKKRAVESNLGQKVMGQSGSMLANQMAEMGETPQSLGRKAMKAGVADKFMGSSRRINDYDDSGMKKGGRAKKATGGDAIGEYLDKNPAPARAPEKRVPLPPPRPKDLDKPKVPEKFMSPYDHTTHGAKRGGKIKKAEGGPLKFHGDPVIPGMKKGGKAHKDEAMDKALIKKMVKPEARKGKAIGGVLGQALSPALMLANAVRGDDDGKKRGGRARKADGGEMMAGAGSGKRTDKPQNVYQPDYNEDSVDKAIKSSRQKIGGKEAGMIKALLKGRTARKEGGGVFSGSGYPNKVPGVTGGRIARATGGKTKKGKAKTNINIVIAAGKPAGGADMMPPPSGIPTDNRGAGGLPVPVPPPQGAPAGMPMPMPVAMPMPMHGGAGAPTGAPPMPRKTGGRISKIASSYKDMQAGAGSGEGRLQKTDIAKKGKGAPTYKTGGKVYRSYKDMDAGAGSGRGRLEKTEIAARKH